jgi:glycosyltransferase involved in cell wall biosynthesis
VKILHVTDLFEPSIGGMETHVLSLVRERVRVGHEMSVATLVKIDGQPSSEIEDVGFRVYRINAGYTRFERAWASSMRPHHPPFPDPVVAHHLRQIIEREHPDVIHAHNWMVYSYLAFKTRRHPPVLWMQHDYSLACPKKTRLYYKGDGWCPGASPKRCASCSVEQYGRAKGAAITLGLLVSNATLLRRADRVIANSAGVARRAEEAVGINGSVEVVSTFVADNLEQEADSVPRPDFLPVVDDYILFVGGLGPFKGIGDLLIAYESLGRDKPPLVVLGTSMAGQPTRWPDNVIVRENVAHAQVMAAWKHCRFGVVPSRWEEPFALVALEASTMGKAVIATNVGGLPEIILDGRTGILVPRRDPEALAQAMRVLLNDPDRTVAMGAAGKEHASAFTVHKSAPRFDRILEELVETHRSRTDTQKRRRRTP